MTAYPDHIPSQSARHAAGPPALLPAPNRSTWFRKAAGQAMWLALLASLHMPGTAAQLVADPGLRDEAQPYQVESSEAARLRATPADAEGFITLSFAAASPDSGSAWLVIRPRTGHWNWQALQAVQMHIQNIMPWPLTLQLQLQDADGGMLSGSIGLPPGPPLRLDMPLAPWQPLAMGMRAGPPIPWQADGERVGLVSFTEGQINTARIAELRIGMPPPEAGQKIRLGKIFLPDAGSNPLQAAYTGIVDAWGQYSRLDWPGKYTENTQPAKAAGPENSQKKTAARKKKGKEKQPDPHLAFQPFARFARTAEQKLQRALASQQAHAGAPPALDAYQGLTGLADPGTGSGYFRTGKLLMKDGSQRHILLSPEGHPFFSIGVNAVQRDNSETFIEGRHFQFQWLPGKDSPLHRFISRRDSTEVLPADSGAQQQRRFLQGESFNFYQANLYRRDGADWQEKWPARTRRRLQQWGFNTVGAWSDESLQGSRQPHTRIVHIDGPFARLSDGHNWWAGIPDPFDPAFGLALDTTLRKATASNRENPALIGWFVDNELGWGDGAASDPAQRYALAWSALQHDAARPEAHAKRALVRLLRERYEDRIDELAESWAVPLQSWAELEAAWPAERRPDGQRPAVAADLSAFLRLHAEAYFSQVARALKRHAPNHLYLGSRFSSRTPEAVSACVRWCDVVSYNLYIPSLDDGFEAAQFARHDKPALLTEFHFGSADRGPFWPGVMRVANESERGMAYRKMLDSVLQNPQFIGAHWFQYLDQPVTGRWLDGENGHLGLVGITDIPWHDFILSVQRSNQAVQQALYRRIQAIEPPASRP